MARPAKPPTAVRLFEEHFARDARFHGDAETKRLVTQTRTVATSIRKLRDSLRQYMSPAQVEALTSAVAALNSIGADAVGACALARQAKVDYDASELRRRADKADQIADGRWGDLNALGAKAAFLNEVRELVDFVDRDGGGMSYREAAQLFGGRQFDLGAEMEGGSSPRLSGLLAAYEQTAAADDLVALRRRAAEYIHAMVAPGRLRSSVNLADFDSWRTARRRTLSGLTAILSNQRTPGPKPGV